jgi:putative ABC transport system ATP-binding protein
VSALIAAERALASCTGVTVTYGLGDAVVVALADVDLVIHPGDSIALWGPSGSGKTTLLHALGGLVTPSTGAVSWKGEPLSSLDSAARTRVRARGVAYVFQGANLLPHFTAFENVAFAIHASAPHDGGLAPEELLALVGLDAKLDALPAELSGGEAQRVAIARALGQRPELLLCDEPTGHLDSDTGERVLNLIDAVQQEFGFALVTATHDTDVAARYDRAVELSDGRVTAEVSYQW